MKVGILFSGGKDSCYATFLAKKNDYEISCLISIFSENKESFMFHTPCIERVKEQARVMEIPLVVVKTKGEKEKELNDLEKAIKKAVKDFGIKGIVTGAVESVYQSSRIQKICNKLNLECFNPLWQKEQIELLNDLIKNKFEIIISGVFAYPLDEKWLGRKIDKNFIKEVLMLRNKFNVSPSGEGGEFESFVLNCPLYNEKLIVDSFEDFGEKNSWSREIRLK